MGTILKDKYDMYTRKSDLISTTHKTDNSNIDDISIINCYILCSDMCGKFGLHLNVSNTKILLYKGNNMLYEFDRIKHLYYYLKGMSEKR
jgi:hypothetical protein